MILILKISFLNTIGSIVKEKKEKPSIQQKLKNKKKHIIFPKKNFDIKFTHSFTHSTEGTCMLQFSSVQSLSRVQLFATL